MLEGPILKFISPMLMKSFLDQAGVSNTQLMLSKGTGVYKEAESCGCIFYISDGSMQISVTSNRSSRKAIAVLNPGDFASVECISALRHTRSESATALTDCTLLRITKEEMARALDEVPALASLFTKFLLRNLNRMQTALLDQLHEPEECLDETLPIS